jgi:hypothetical protein
MSNADIDDFAHAVLKDYKPELLKEPGKIDMEHFLEHYLDAEIQYMDIYYKDPTKPIRALTTLNDGDVRIFDRENNCVSYVYLPARTVGIDNEVTELGKEGMALFSGLHEGNHLLLHWDVFVDEYGRPYEKNGDLASVICCQRSTVENTKFSEKRTLSDWWEHQADYGAAALAMPNATFKPFVHQFLREHGVHRGSIITGRNSDSDILANDLLPEYISEVYGVSKRAARIKLNKCGFVYGKDDIKL